MTKSKIDIAFVGGIHGSGKSSILMPVCEKLKLKYLSASEIIKWNEISPDDKNKNVADISFTQNRLISGLKAMTTNGGNFVLDGHTCLFNSDGKVSRIPLDNFRLINPKNIIIFSADVSEVKNRLEIRDKREYSLRALEQMQKDEIKHAKDIAELLNIPFHLIENANQSKIAELFIKMFN